MKNYVNGFGKWSRLNEQEDRMGRFDSNNMGETQETELILTLGTDFAEYAEWFAKYAEICPDCRIMDVTSGGNDMEFTVVGPEDQIAALQQEQRTNMGMDDDGDFEIRRSRF